MAETNDTPGKPGRLSRRHALGLLGTAGAGAAATPLLGATPAQAATPTAGPAFRPTPDRSGASPVQGLHLTFGADPATRMNVSWLTDSPVSRPRVAYGTWEHGMGSTADALLTADAPAGRTVRQGPREDGRRAARRPPGGTDGPSRRIEANLALS